MQRLCKVLWNKLTHHIQWDKPLICNKDDTLQAEYQIKQNIKPTKLFALTQLQSVLLLMGRLLELLNCSFLIAI